MISKVNELLEGKVVKGINYESDKKIIGVAAGNLIADAQGIVPLSKQGAFIQEEKIDSVLQEALNINVEDIEGKFEGEDGLLDNDSNPIEIGDTSVLSNTQTPKMDLPFGASAFIPEIKDDKPTVIDDLELPEMPVVPAFEPVTSNVDIFDSVKDNNESEQNLDISIGISDEPSHINLPQFDTTNENQEVEESNNKKDEIGDMDWQAFFSGDSPIDSKSDNVVNSAIEDISVNNDVVKENNLNDDNIVIPNIFPDEKYDNSSELSNLETVVGEDGELEVFKNEAYEEMRVAMSRILEDYFRKVDNYYNSNKLGM